MNFIDYAVNFLKKYREIEAKVVRRTPHHGILETHQEPPSRYYVVVRYTKLPKDVIGITHIFTMSEFVSEYPAITRKEILDRDPDAIKYTKTFSKYHQLKEYVDFYGKYPDSSHELYAHIRKIVDAHRGNILPQIERERYEQLPGWVWTYFHLTKAAARYEVLYSKLCRNEALTSADRALLKYIHKKRELGLFDDIYFDKFNIYL